MASKKKVKKTPTKKVTKPKFVPDYAILQAIAGLFPTDEEIAVRLGCSVRTVRTLKKQDGEYIRIVNEAQQNAKTKLRQLQFQQAMNGNTTMLIFLGKQKLGQADTVKHQGDPAVPVESRTSINLDPKQMAAAVKALKSETS